MFSSNIWMAHHSAMLSSCSFCTGQFSFSFLLWPGLPPWQSPATSQGAFVEVTAPDKKLFVLFEQLVWVQPAEMGEGSFWPCLLERLNLQRMCWVLTPHGPCECSVLVWTLAFSIRVKYIVCYYHTVKLIFTILCMIYLRFHWTKQASGTEFCKIKQHCLLTTSPYFVMGSKLMSCSYITLLLCYSQ